MNEQLEALIAKWRAEGARCDSFHATMGIGFKKCADELDAALAAAQASSPEVYPSKSVERRVKLMKEGRASSPEGDVTGAEPESTPGANACLIAAAPDLLAACRLALGPAAHYASEFDDEEPWTALRAAIAKADGRAG